LLLGAIRSLRFAGVLMAGLLLVECLALRLHPVRQIEVSALAEPSSARAIKAQPDWQDYRMTDLSSGMGDMLADPWAADAVPNFLRMKTAMSGMTPAIWGLRSMKGALALPLARWKLADAVLDEEIAGTGGLSPGLRLIDVLAVRYVSADATIARPAFREFWHEPGMSWITENTAALPRFQIYDRQVFVDTPEAALDYIENWKERVLVVEDPSRSAEQPETAIGPPESTAEPATFSVQHASETAYRLSVTASRPCWLFLADANYPGWGATVDGVETKVLSAQLLGKAVRIPAGQHEVRMEFHSSSVARGALISAVALIVTAYLIIFGWRRPWPRPSRLAAAAGADES